MSRKVVNIEEEQTGESKVAIIYLRVSTKEQAEKNGDEGYSIPAQRDACRRKAQSLGAEVTAEFLDAGESARSSDRPELQRLLAYVADKRPDYIIVHKIDRLARNLADDVTINVALQKAGVTLVSCSENIDETPSGKLLHGIMASIAEFYSRNLGTEALKGMTQKAQQGGTSGRAPIGYLNVGKLINGREVRTVELDTERAPLIKWAFEAFATGDWTLLKLRDELTAQGLRTLPTRGRASEPLVLSRIQAMLRNRYYVGKIIFKGVEYDGSHPKLVTITTFNNVQAALDSHRAGEKQRSHPHYLKSSVYCGLCGSRMCITRTINRWGKEYLYFFCVGRHQRRTNCRLKSVSVANVEEQVEHEWSKVQLDSRYAALLQELVQADLKKLQDINVRTDVRVSRQLERKRAERQRLLDAYYHDAISIELFKTEQLRVTKEIEAMELKLVNSRLKIANLETVLARSLAFLVDPQATYCEAPPALRRQFNQAVFERFEVYPEDQLVGSVSDPFRTLLDSELLTAIDGQTPEVACAWERGMPTWLRQHPIWARQTSAQAMASVGAVGLKDDLLAPPTGFEPVLPP